VCVHNETDRYQPTYSVFAVMRECNAGTYCTTTEVELRAGQGWTVAMQDIGLGASLNPRSTTLVTSRPIRSPGNLLIGTGAADRERKGAYVWEERGDWDPGGINRSWCNGMFIRPHELARVDWIDDVGGLLGGDTSKTGET